MNTELAWYPGCTGGEGSAWVSFVPRLYSGRGQCMGTRPCNHAQEHDCNYSLNLINGDNTTGSWGFAWSCAQPLSRNESYSLHVWFGLVTLDTHKTLTDTYKIHTRYPQNAHKTPPTRHSHTLTRHSQDTHRHSQDTHRTPTTRHSHTLTHTPKTLTDTHKTPTTLIMLVLLTKFVSKCWLNHFLYAELE